jgi:NitT/TauT family transport system substrate-binding protein
MNVSRQRAIQLAAAAVAAPQVAAAQAVAAPITVRVGSQPAEFTADLIYGIEQGFFQRADLSIDLQMMANGAQTGAAIIGGALDIGLTDPLTVAQGHVRGIDFVFIAPAAGFATPWPLAFATRPDDGIRDAKDFNGKTIGIGSIKNAPTVMSRYWIDHNGGDSTSVKWLEIPFSETVAAIVSKRIDGALLGEPYLTQARDAGLHITLMVRNTSAAFWMVTGWTTTREWANRNTDTVRRFASAMRESNHWGNTHVAESVPIVAKYTKLPETVIAGMMRHPWIETLRAADVQPVIDTCAQYGVLPRTFPAKEILYEVR